MCLSVLNTLLCMMVKFFIARARRMLLRLTAVLPMNNTTKITNGTYKRMTKKVGGTISNVYNYGKHN